MPRIVYGVLDVHRSHRIEIPKPPGADATASARPDACTLCHVAGVVGGPAGRGPLRSIFAADALGRAVAADALGRAPPSGGEERERRVGALLTSMEHDRYPAVRHLAWRGLRRLIAPGAAPDAGLGADYDPSADGPVRRAAVERVRQALGPAVRDPGGGARAALDAIATGPELEIGE
jgi:hypothetical protein